MRPVSFSSSRVSFAQGVIRKHSSSGSGVGSDRPVRPHAPRVVPHLRVHGDPVEEDRDAGPGRVAQRLELVGRRDGDSSRVDRRDAAAQQEHDRVGDVAHRVSAGHASLPSAPPGTPRRPRAGPDRARTRSGRRPGRHLAQESLLHQPAQRFLGLVRRALDELFEQAPAREPFRRVGRLRMLGVVAQELSRQARTVLVGHAMYRRVRDARRGPAGSCIGSD